MHIIQTIGFNLNEIKQLIGEISIEKLLKYHKKDGFYCEAKREVALKVYQSTVLEYFSQFCTKKITLEYLFVYLPIEKQEEFVTRLKELLKNELIHVSALFVL